MPTARPPTGTTAATSCDSLETFFISNMRSKQDKFLLCMAQCTNLFSFYAVSHSFSSNNKECWGNAPFEANLEVSNPVLLGRVIINLRFFGQEVHYYMIYIAYFIFHISYFIFHISYCIFHIFLDKGFPKGGGGGWSDVWEKFPNNIVFLFESVTYLLSKS